MAEGIFRQIVKEANLSHVIRVDSAGTSAYHVGERTHSGTLRVLKKHNIPYDGRSRQFTRGDFHKFDYILAMDNSNLRSIRSQMPSDTTARIALLLDYADGLPVRDVPDPYYGGRFDEVFEMVKAGVEGLLAEIRQTHGL